MDFLPRRRWSFNFKEGTISATASTRRYDLPKWVDNINNIKIFDSTTTSGLPLKRITRTDFKRLYEDTTITTAIGEHYAVGPRTRTTYTTGTLSGTSGAKVLTGSSTSWSASSGFEQFDVIQVGSYAYTINSIDSDTQITLFEDIVTDISASTSYIGG